jgi:hypothetical protein
MGEASDGIVRVSWMHLVIIGIGAVNAAQDVIFRHTEAM